MQKKKSINLYLIIFLITTKTIKTTNPDNSLENTCNDELIISYKLYPFEKVEEQHRNYICPFIKNDCCAFASQKLVQILWAKLSNPRIQRLLTRNLFYIENIIGNMKSVLKLFKKNVLPENDKYSAECLTSLEDMNDYIDGGLEGKLDTIFEDIKEKFTLLYDFKKQFYCNICNQEYHEYFKIFDRQIYYNNNFCQLFAEDFKDITWFLNYEIIKYFQTIRKYILCYKEKNFLLIQNLDKFIFKRNELRDISECRDNQECTNLCQRYSFSQINDIFIGDIEQLKKMFNFLDENQVDERGFVEKVVEEKKFGKQADFTKIDFFQDEGVKGVKKDIEEIQLEFYEHSYKSHRKREVTKKMKNLKIKVNSEFDEKNLHQLFITVNESELDLDDFNLVLKKDGLNPYILLNKIDIYKTNANLTLFLNPISNAVPELLDLNKTDIIEKIFNTTKLMKEKNGEEDMKSYLESKVFEGNVEGRYFMVEDPDIDVARMESIELDNGVFKGFGVFLWFLFIFN